MSGVWFREAVSKNIAEGSDPDLPPPGEWEVVDEGTALMQREKNRQEFDLRIQQDREEARQLNKNFADAKFAAAVDALTEPLGEEAAVALAQIVVRGEIPTTNKENQ